jgi:predicted flap endonuclease-1-like 5' DNA nuclease
VAGLGTLGAVKRLARIVGLLGGLGAVLWAMRDRLVSVAIPREPQPPAFRVPEPTPAPPPPSDGSITDISGIGPVYANRLTTAGIGTLADLAQADAGTVAEAAKVPLSRAEAWIEAASAR